MGLRLSTAMRNALLETGSFIDTINNTAAATDTSGSKLIIFRGSVPASADDAVPSTDVLVVIENHVGSTNYNLNFGAASGGVIAKDADTWSGTIATAGTATFFRMITAADNGYAADSGHIYPRLQGEISADGTAVGTLSNTSLTSGTQIIEYFYLSLPTE